MSKDEITLAENIAKAVADCGGVAYYIGGFVRDRLRKEENKDVDIEIHGITPEKLEEILDSFGQRISIGESFGIYNIKGYSLDIAMPRKEDNRGDGHRDFDICVNPFIGTYKAAIRRDFTINALMQNVLTGEIIDHFGGIGDMEKKILRHISDDTFAEDPLRVLRGAQFASRFAYTVAPETTRLCSQMKLDALAKERVFSELEKALLKADKPSIFFNFLREINQLSCWFPELEALIGVKQPPRFHAEGDAWTHTMMVLDAATGFREKAKSPLGFMLSALCHDFGKAICTFELNGSVHAYGHETEGLPLIKKFLRRLTAEKTLIDYVLNLCEYHMKPHIMCANGSSIKSTNKMFDSSLDPQGLIYLATSDVLGQISEEDNQPNTEFLLQRLAIYDEYMSRPYVMGRDLIEAGLPPSEHFGEYLGFAHKLRLAGIDKENALRQTLAYARKNK